ncbi:MAG TPA: DUF5694 domain-containing protein [Sphingomicrobium sp.]|jgi:hypothetical protein
MLPLLALAAAQTFAAGVPAFDPRDHKQEIAGKPAQVLVLGSMHLSQLPSKIDPALLEPLLKRLEAFRPDVITIEGLSGEECETLKNFKPQHDGAWSDYCWDTADVEKETGLTVPAAVNEVQKTLASWPKAPSPAQRRHLAMLFLAANERASATVQWLRLPGAERHAGDGLSQAMIDVIERKGKAPNESYAIGSALAARLGLERVYTADDHIADGVEQGDDYGKAIQAVWNAKPTPAVFAEYKRHEKNVGTSAALMDYYRWLNEPATQRAAIASDMGRAARDTSSQHYGRQYLSWWENRNLRMAANIRGSFGNRPDARVLVLVGATHKGYLDAYLNMMQDVRLVDAMQFLK